MSLLTVILIICTIFILSKIVYYQKSLLKSLPCNYTDYSKKELGYSLFISKIIPFFNNKSAAAKKIIFILSFMILVYSLFLSVLPGTERRFVWALDENFQCTYPSSVCAYAGECDTYPSQTSCAQCAGRVGAWGTSVLTPGGTYVQSSCCGDDSGEYVRTETGGADAPADFKNSGTTCCSSSINCNYDSDDTCTANSSTKVGTGGTAFCNSGLWDGADDSLNACNNLVAASRWSLGGDASATTCCGDDAGDNMIAETSAADAPSPYNTGSGTSCCAVATDCTESGTDTCTLTANYAGIIPNRAYCNSGTWQGGDDASAACASIAGTNRWAIGGEVHGNYCCGDDSEEYNLTRQVDESVLPGFADDISDNGCCTATTDCIISSNCIDSDTHATDADGNGDTDYCLSNTWYDCYTDQDCPTGLICSASIHDCVNPDGGILIRNLGTTGIEASNQEFTSSRNVILVLNYTANVVYCRYTNYPNRSETPPFGYGGWTPWETCITNRIWLLSENSSNLKVVFYQLNFSNRNSTFNDTIYFNFTGGGLDTTPPTKPVVYHVNYTNDNQNITIYWYNSSDIESALFGIPLQYHVILYNSSGEIASVYTTSNYYPFNLDSDLRQPHNASIYANVSAINSAGMKTNGTSNVLKIDMLAPTINLLEGSFLNISSNSRLSINSLSGEDLWVYAATVNFTWNASDDISDINSYSYILSQSPTLPDEIPEGDLTNFSGSKTKQYSSMRSGKYYFFVKSKDKAGNWGESLSLNFSIDNTPPSTPRILSTEWGSDSITYTWQQSTDTESLVVYYVVNLTDTNGAFIRNITTTFTYLTIGGLSTLDYNATVCAYNGAGIPRYSNQEIVVTDFEPPNVRAGPNRTVIKDMPYLKAWTDEPSVCNYNSSGTTVRFKYSNTTYHESRLPNLIDGPYTYVITCSDIYENAADPIYLNFTVENGADANSILGPNQFTTYKDILTTFTVQVKSAASQELAELPYSKFSLKLDGKAIEFSVFDLGNSFYNISFEPPDTIGEHSLDLTIDGIPKEINFTELDLSFSITYEDSNIGLSQKSTQDDRIVYFEGARKFGIATDADITLSSQPMDMFNMTGIGVGENVYIFNTKQSANLQDREKRIIQDKFLNSVNPSFAYGIDDRYFIYYILKYRNYALSSDFDESLGTGRHNLRIQRLYEDGKIKMEFSKKDQSEDKTIITS
ncbi:MAG: fibronectin type III domain-containing protein [archaeon]